MDSPKESLHCSMLIDAAEELILRWDSTASEDARKKMIFEIDRYLRIVDEFHRSMSSVKLSEGGGGGEQGDKVSSTVQIAMARLEDEFRNILLSHTSPLEADSLMTESSSLVRSSISFADGAEVDFYVDDDLTHKGQDLRSFEVQAESSRKSSVSYRSMSSIHEVDLVPSEVIYDLQCITERMISCGYL